MKKILNRKKVLNIFFVLVLVAGLGFFLFGLNSFSHQAESQNLQLDEQEATIRAIKANMPAVVNISVLATEKISSVNLDTGETIQKEKQDKIGAGTGFIVSSDGLIITNKHVVKTPDPEKTQYRVILSSGKKYYAKLVDKDPVNDLAVLKIYDKDLPFVKLGESDSLETGMTVIAIGNALGQYQNTVTKGIISGLGRDFMATDPLGQTQDLHNTIQTDADINLGNSGGPLIDLHGRVVGVNVAMDAGGNSIGFAIPINDVRPVIQSVKETGLIKRPRLGVYYTMITPEIAYEENLPRKEGAWIASSKDQPAVLPNSSAEEAGLRDGDIIFEINAIKIKGKNNLRSVIHRYKPGDKIGLKIQRGDKIIIRQLVLDKF